MDKSDVIIAQEKEVAFKLDAHRQALRGVSDGPEGQEQMKKAESARQEWLKALDKLEKLKKQETEKK